MSFEYTVVSKIISSKKKQENQTTVCRRGKNNYIQLYYIKIGYLQIIFTASFRKVKYVNQKV